MLQLAIIRNQTELVKERLAVRNFKEIGLVDQILTLDEERRTLTLQVEENKAKLNQTSKEIGQLMAKGQKEEAEQRKKDVEQIKTSIEPAQARLDTLINRTVKEGIPLLFGEAPQPKVGPNCATDFPYSSLMSQCQANEIGWLVWSWGSVNNGDCGSPHSPFDITTDGIYGNWEHPWNKDVVIDNANSIQKTAVRPASLIHSK